MAGFRVERQTIGEVADLIQKAKETKGYLHLQDGKTLTVSASKLDDVQTTELIDFLFLTFQSSSEEEISTTSLANILELLENKTGTFSFKIHAFFSCLAQIFRNENGTSRKLNFLKLFRSFEKGKESEDLIKKTSEGRRTFEKSIEKNNRERLSIIYHRCLNGIEPQRADKWKHLNGSRGYKQLWVLSDDLDLVLNKEETKKTYSEKELNSINEVFKALEQAATIAFKIEELEKKDVYESKKLAYGIKSAIKEARPSCPLMIPIGYARHATIGSVKKEGDGTYTFSIFNTGRGVNQYHHTQEETNKYQVELKWSGLTEEKLQHSNFIEELINIQVNRDSSNTMPKLYALLEKHLGKPDPISQNPNDFHQRQKKGNCTYKSIAAWLRGTLGDSLYEKLKADLTDEFLERMIAHDSDAIEQREDVREIYKASQSVQEKRRRKATQHSTGPIETENLSSENT